jgi:DNA-directed RNA polymerase specialized sigma24 family protein
MEEDVGTDTPLWIADAGDRKRESPLGGNDQRNIPKPLIEAAQRTWRDAVEYAVRHLGDKARAAEVVDGVVYSAAKAYRQKPIENPESYLLSGVMRRVRRLLAREQRIEYVGSLEALETLKEARDTAWVAKLEDHLLLEEIVTLMDEPTKDIYLKWARGDSWKEIAGDIGIRVGAAKERFRHGVEKARERVFRSKSARPKPVPL